MFGLKIPSLASTKKGQLAGALEIVIGIAGITLMLVVGNVMMGQLNTVNANNLGNNSNATAAIGTGFSQFATAQSITTLVIVVALLGLALASFLGVFRRGG